MKFLRKLVINLILIVVLFLVVYIIYPDIMGQVFQTYWMLFGPIGLLLLVVTALPRSRRG